MREIYIRRMRYHEAKDKLVEELNRAFLDRIEEVRVIHGKGSGILKEMVAQTVEELGFCEIIEDPFSQNPGTTMIKIWSAPNQYSIE